MARAVGVVFLGLLFSVGVNAQVAGVSSCKESCEATYPKHTFEKGYMQDSCLLGCRLLLLACRHSGHSTMQQCHHGCNSSYEGMKDLEGKESRIQSCYQGCNFMKPAEAERLRALMDVINKQHFEMQARVFGMLHGIMSQMSMFSDEPDVKHVGLHSPENQFNRVFIRVDPPKAQSEVVITEFVVRDDVPWKKDFRMFKVKGEGSVEEEPVLMHQPEEGRSCWRRVLAHGPTFHQLLVLICLLFLTFFLLRMICSMANSRKREKCNKKAALARAFMKYPTEATAEKNSIPEGIAVHNFPLPEKSKLIL